jgi:hypothetical protein
VLLRGVQCHVHEGGSFLKAVPVPLIPALALTFEYIY